MDVSDYVAQMNKRQELAENLYPQLVRVNKRLGLRRLTYRCRSRCMLLDAIETPAGIVLHQKRYKFSEAHNDTVSSPEGRRVNTYDGSRHWRSRTYFRDVSALREDWEAWEQFNSHMDLQCDHVRVDLYAPLFAADWASDRKEVTLPRAS